MTACWNCGSAVESNQFHRQDSCSKCRADTHVCKNCEHFDPSFNNQCKESSADRVVDKERSNFCDYFRPGSQAGGTARSAADLKAAAAALFKKR